MSLLNSTSGRWISAACIAAAVLQTVAAAEGGLPWVAVAADRSGFVLQGTGQPFRVWGVNYDHDESEGQRLLEDYWHEDWETVTNDFGEIRELGANVVRVHLQFGAFMKSATEPDPRNLKQLTSLLRLAESAGLYLDITGLGCYHKQDVPAWYDALDEEARWQAQAGFWSAVAATGAGSPAVFCYDLMNEPILAGNTVETNWLAGDFGGKHFVQRISLNLAGRTREQVAAAWGEKMVNAIREKDQRHLITVGVIPWALTWPGAKPIFYSPAPARHLDFVAVHFYPEKDGVEKALEALRVYDIGKPLIVEEFFPLRCGIDEMEQFIEGARELSDGWISFYWGRTVEEYGRDPGGGLAAAIKAAWLKRFKELSTRMR